MRKISDLPHEIQLCMIDETELADQRTLRLVNRHFNLILRLNVLKHDLVAHWTIFQLKKKKDKGVVGYAPFLVREVEVKEGKIALHVYKPVFMRSDERVENLDLLIENEQLELYMSRSSDQSQVWAARDKSRDAILDYDSICDTLVRASGSSIRHRFECPECSGRRKICPGCGGVSSRWSELFAGCGLTIPCPCCMGYNAALNGKYNNEAEDQR